MPSPWDSNGLHTTLREICTERYLGQMLAIRVQGFVW
jgi:hypothetical protein